MKERFPSRAEEEQDMITFMIPLRGGLEVPVKVKWKTDVVLPESMVLKEDMTFYEFLLHPETKEQAVRVVEQKMREQTKLSPSQMVDGFLAQVGEGATLGWGEEAASYMSALPYLMPGGKTYTEAREEHVEKARAFNQLYTFLHPTAGDIGQAVGLSIPIAAAIAEPTLAGEGAVGSYMTAGTVARAMNPFAVAGKTVPETVIESVLKAVVLSGTHAAGAKEGYLEDRLKDISPAYQEGFEWGVITNTVLFGGIRAWQAMMKVPAIKHHLTETNFIRDYVSEDLLRRIAQGEKGISSLREKAYQWINDRHDMDIQFQRTGVKPTQQMLDEAQSDLSPLKKAERPTGLTLGEEAGPFVGSLQRHASRVDPVSGAGFRQFLDRRHMAEGDRVSAALRERQPAHDRSVYREDPLSPRVEPPIRSVDESIATRERRIAGESELRGEPVGLLGAEPLPQGVAGAYYKEGYSASSVPLSGNFMNLFKADLWKTVYNQKDFGAVALREGRIRANESPEFLPNGLSNQLPSWEDFLGGIRYIPKSTAKKHGTTVKQQLNPKTGLWQEYRNTPHSKWKTRKRVVFDDFKVIEQQRKPSVKQQQNPTTKKWQAYKDEPHAGWKTRVQKSEWTDVKAGQNPRKGWETQQKTDGTNWAVRLNEKNISFESLHDLRQAADSHVEKLSGKEGGANAARLANKQRIMLDSHVKLNPNMAKADQFWTEMEKMKTAAKAGKSAWNDNLYNMVNAYEKMGPNERRMYRNAFIEQTENKGYTATQLSEGDIGGVGRVQDRLRMIYPEGEMGDLMYQRMMEELNISKRMADTRQMTTRPSDAEMAEMGHQKPGLMRTLSFLAKIPAYKFSMEFALGRDLIEQARNVDSRVKVGVAREVSDILNTLSGPQAARELEKLASNRVRMRGNVPVADSLRNLADMFRSAVTYQEAGKELPHRGPPIEGVATGERFDTPIEFERDKFMEMGPPDVYGRKPRREYPLTQSVDSLLDMGPRQVKGLLEDFIPWTWRGPR